MAKQYNLYYKSGRINKRPLSEDTVKEIIKIGKPIRRVVENGVEDIPLNKIRIVKCTVV
jgi:CRISPR/Cas system-associated exonuclease Cas4 (RecB family)